MFVPDPVATLMAMRGMLKKDGVLALGFWNDGVDVPFLSLSKTVIIFW